jgi:hypothetical protein
VQKESSLHMTTFTPSAVGQYIDESQVSFCGTGEDVGLSVFAAELGLGVVGASVGVFVGFPDGRLVGARVGFEVGGPAGASVSPSI